MNNKFLAFHLFSCTSGHLFLNTKTNYIASVAHPNQQNFTQWSYTFCLEKNNSYIIIQLYTRDKFCYLKYFLKILFKKTNYRWCSTYSWGASWYRIGEEQSPKLKCLRSLSIEGQWQMKIKHLENDHTNQ